MQGKLFCSPITNVSRRTGQEKVWQSTIFVFAWLYTLLERRALSSGKHATKWQVFKIYFSLAATKTVCWTPSLPSRWCHNLHHQVLCPHSVLLGLCPCVRGLWRLQGSSVSVVSVGTKPEENPSIVSFVFNAKGCPALELGTLASNDYASCKCKEPEWRGGVFQWVK